MCRLARPGPELEGRGLVGDDPGADQPCLGDRVRGEPAAEAGWGGRSRRPGQRGVSSVAVHGAPVDDLAAGDPDRVELVLLGVWGEDEAGAGVDGRGTGPRRFSSPSMRARVAAARPRARSAAVAGLRDLFVDAREERLAAVPADEEFERGFEPFAVEVGVQVVQAGRQAAAHLAVGGRMLAAGQLTAAVPQAEEGVELLDELGRRRGRGPGRRRPRGRRRARARPRGSGTGCPAGSGCRRSRRAPACRARCREAAAP